MNGIDSKVSILPRYDIMPATSISWFYTCTFARGNSSENRNIGGSYTVWVETLTNELWREPIEHYLMRHEGNEKMRREQGQLGGRNRRERTTERKRDGRATR